MSAPASGLRAIRICGYRGFPYPVEVRLDGRSLVLYGENGSGKSSFGKAVRDCLDARKNAENFDTFRYRHANPPRDDRCVALMFNGDDKADLVWKPGGRDTAHPDFHDMARALGWLDYRTVWRISDVQYGDSVEIFTPLVEAILPGCQRGVSGETFGAAWARIREMAEKNLKRVYHHKRQLERLMDALEQFNESLQAFLPELQQHANDLLASFVPWTRMELVWKSGAGYDTGKWPGRKFSPGSVHLRLLDRDNTALAKPAEFLNEARMTAVGLCLYLAGMARSIPPRRADGSTYPRLLILDDVLLSLDMAHRLPLLRVLREHFTDWQVLLLTHDRVWYEISRQQLPGWAHAELFVQQVGDYGQPLLRADQDHLGWALDFLLEGHVKAAAVHVRTKFEEVLKRACAELRLPVPYKPDPRKVTANELWNAVQGATWDQIPPISCATDGRGQKHWWQPRPVKQPLVPSDLKDRITHALSWVLNPLSHSESVDRHRQEIEDAIFAVAELEQAVQHAIAAQQAGPVAIREMLLQLLGFRVAQLEPTSCSPSPSPA
jgi:energy-coupling factor transporter ATP-binding protein EcfA2